MVNIYLKNNLNLLSYLKVKLLKLLTKKWNCLKLLKKLDSWFGGNIDNKVFESAITFWFKDVDFDGDKVWEYFHMNN